MIEIEIIWMVNLLLIIVGGIGLYITMVGMVIIKHRSNMEEMFGGIFFTILGAAIIFFIINAYFPMVVLK